ncbi:MAG: YbaB/EbfC family nucleoid-associated protein [Actinomycetes bacterium]
MFGDGQFDVQALLAQAQQMQDRLAMAQRELAEARVNGSAGGGLVSATVDGAGTLLGVSIDPRALAAGGDLEETATLLSDLVLAAVRDAVAGTGQLQARTMGPVTDGLPADLFGLAVPEGPGSGIGPGA